MRAETGQLDGGRRGDKRNGFIEADYTRLLDVHTNSSADRSSWSGTTSTPTSAGQALEDQRIVSFSVLPLPPS
jgi:hypothetical protein